MSGHGRYQCPCAFTHVRLVVYIIGVVVSLWQTMVCLDKYLSFIRSTQVSMKKSTETYLPALGNLWRKLMLNSNLSPTH